MKKGTMIFLGIVCIVILFSLFKPTGNAINDSENTIELPQEQINPVEDCSEVLEINSTNECLDESPEILK
jgi:cbb3-type cytochrome oxidase subunit 3